jgi:glycosyltransferase involved in cell wall biosynthesis
LELISVIIPVYNTEPYLKSCIESVLCQTYPQFELLLVDDGSTDHSPEICDRYAGQDARVSVFHVPNGGVSAARNYGIKKARGTYVAFVDSDDRVDEDYLELLISGMEPGGLSVLNLTSGENAGKREKRVTIMERGSAQISVYSCHGIQGYPVSKLFDRKILLEHHVFFDTKIAIGEDILFVIQYISCVKSRISWNESEPYHYRQTNDGAVNRRFFPHPGFGRRDLTEVDAVKKSAQYLVDDPRVQKACRLRLVKAMVATLRGMEANSCCEEPYYTDMRRFVRKHAIAYLTGSIGQTSSKLSVALSVLSPKLELAVWRRYNR